MDELLAEPVNVSENGFGYQKGECDILQKQMSQLEAQYFKNSHLDFVLCGTPAKVLDEQGKTIGQFVSTSSAPYFEFTTGEKEFSARIPVQEFKSGFDLNPTEIECLQIVDGKKIERPSCTSHLRNSVATTDGYLSAVIVPELTKDKFYSSAGKIAQA